ncbi:MAG: transcriptional repressor [Candidatus Eremiobacteraeota bacterium]|nr:transcriptional repressor [Candidatus Eremiobacteraeota bacterium]
MKQELIKRVTTQRKVILDEIKKNKTHPTAEEFYEILRKRLPRISIGTVYRNLEILHKAGLVSRFEMGNLQRRYDGNADPHYHIRCIECNRLDDICITPLAGIEEEVRTLSSYEVRGHILEFVGICPSCGGEVHYKAPERQIKPKGGKNDKGKGKKVTQGDKN